MTKRELPIYHDDSIRLRLLEDKDLPLTRAWRNQDSIRKWFLNPNIIGQDQHEAWYCQYRERDDDFVFIIEENAEVPRPVGQISIYHIDWENRRAEYGRLMIGENSARGKGIAKGATQLVLNIAFNNFGMKEIYLEVLSENYAALSVYRDCGFVETGRANGLIFMSVYPMSR